MRACSPLLYFDREDHTWIFNIKNSGELMYSIMYEEDKWTKENKIDNEVLDFTVKIDSHNNIYIIYSIKGGELKYSIWENNQWLCKTLYIFDNKDYEISELNVNTIERYTHIFFIAKNKNKQCALIHFVWGNEENSINIICNLSFIQQAYSHYQTEVSNEGNISLFFINNQENEAAIKITEYKENKWSAPKRLYGINGNNINFCTLQYNGKINILNLSKERSVYSLEQVLIEQDGKMKSNKIYEGLVEPKNYSLFEMNKVLWAMWSDGEKVFTSSYKGHWSEAVLYDNEIKEGISTYKYLSTNNIYINIKAKYILGTMPPEIKLFFLQDKKKGYTEYPQISSNGMEDMENLLQYNREEKKHNNTENDILILKKNNKNFEKKIIDLQLQLQQRQRIIEESGENFQRLTNARKKAEEKLNILNEVHQAAIRELEEMKKQKTALDNIAFELKSKVKERNIDNEQLKKELEAIKKQKIAKDNLVVELKNKLQEFAIENEQLKVELKYENNKGIVDRILKKKLDR